MQDPPISDEATLPHQESKHIIQQLSSERASIDDFQVANDTIPKASLNIQNDRTIGGDYETITDGTLASQSVDRRSGDTLRDEKGGDVIPAEKIGGYSSSSDTIGDEEKQLRAQKDTALGQNSSSNIGDVEKQERGTTSTNLADQASVDSSRDLEKGKTDSQDHNLLNQDDGDKRQAHWENNVVGWNGPNDPQNPHNWKKSKKYTITALYSSMTLCITFASSIFSTATMVTAKMYGVSNEVMTLGTSLFVLVSASTQHHSHPALKKNNRASPLVQLYGVPSLNSTGESSLSSSASSSSPSFKYPSL